MKNFMKVVVLLLLMTSCHPKTETQQVSGVEIPKLYIKTTTATGEGGTQVFTDTTTMVESDNFEVTLTAMGIGLAIYYYGSKDIGNGKFFNIVESDTIAKFIGSGEFLNYMSERGYKVVNEERNEIWNHYTFKRE